MTHLNRAIYRLGNKSEKDLYEKGLFPTQHNGRSVHFSEIKDALSFYKNNKNKTHSKDNEMDVMYTLIVDKSSKPICTSVKNGKCKSLFFDKNNFPKIIMVKSETL